MYADAVSDECSLDDCSSPVRSKGLCTRHYYLERRTGHVRGRLVECQRCGEQRHHSGVAAAHRLCERCRAEWSICCQCEQILPLDSFSKDRGKAKVRCRSCDVQHRAGQPKRLVHHKKSPEQIRRSNLKRLYGITPEQYQQMVEDQDNLCAICGNGGEQLVVDHCHRKGSVRKLLCGGCNSGLGMFRDDPARLSKAIQYLTDHD